jgi:hypothetical protein
MNRLKTIFAAGLLYAIVACASLGIAPAQSFDAKLGYAYGLHTAVLETAAVEVSAGALSKADGANILTLADKARDLLDSARAVETTNTADAGNKLLLATDILTQLQGFLQKLQSPGAAPGTGSKP